MRHRGEGDGAKARLNWARRAATDSLHDQPQATARFYPYRSISCRLWVRRLMGEIAMANFNAGPPAREVRQSDEGLAYEVGGVHDYFWHRRHRARRGGQPVDIAILVSLAAMVSWVLLLHH